MQTTEGDQIAQLIAGYIDIILKKRQAKDNYGVDNDEDAAMLEDTVTPHRYIPSSLLLQRFRSCGLFFIDG